MTLFGLLNEEIAFIRIKSFKKNLSNVVPIPGEIFVDAQQPLDNEIIRMINFNRREKYPRNQVMDIVTMRRGVWFASGVKEQTEISNERKSIVKHIDKLRYGFDEEMSGIAHGAVGEQMNHVLKRTGVDGFVGKISFPQCGRSIRYVFEEKAPWSDAIKVVVQCFHYHRIIQNICEKYGVWLVFLGLPKLRLGTGQVDLTSDFFKNGRESVIEDVLQPANQRP